MPFLLKTAPFLLILLKTIIFLLKFFFMTREDMVLE